MSPVTKSVDVNVHVFWCLQSCPVPCFKNLCRENKWWLFYLYKINPITRLLTSFRALMSTALPSVLLSNQQTWLNPLVKYYEQEWLLLDQGFQLCLCQPQPSSETILNWGYLRASRITRAAAWKISSSHCYSASGSWLSVERLAELSWVVFPNGTLFTIVHYFDQSP